eukprot:6051157-Pleurochrysis_carterae.AAC.1
MALAPRRHAQRRLRVVQTPFIYRLAVRQQGTAGNVASVELQVIARDADYVKNGNGCQQFSGSTWPAHLMYTDLGAKNTKKYLLCGYRCSISSIINANKGDILRGSSIWVTYICHRQPRFCAPFRC